MQDQDHKRADRRTRTERTLERRVRFYLGFMDGPPRKGYPFRSKHPMDCGKTGCVVCHADKVYREKRAVQERADWDMREQLDER